MQIFPLDGLVSFCHLIKIIQIFNTENRKAGIAPGPLIFSVGYQRMKLMLEVSFSSILGYCF
ncbi:MAG: hypothetical protein Q8942_18245 [Bacillota bacterium]|nr:hypothetical protein [Bacillota bacterium]